MNVTHDSAAQRFAVTTDGLDSELDYRLTPGVMHITHTGVPRALEGRGIAGAMTEAALTWARAQGLKVNPVCSYAAAYLRRHPQWADLR